jgi:hypothetical protein
MTARRLFIGPIPDGWVQSHRNQWYKARISYRDYASRTTSFAPKTMHFDDAHGYIDAPDVPQRDEEIPECQTVGNAEDGNSTSICAPAASDRTIRAKQQQQRESLSEPDDTGTVTDRQGTVKGDGPAISSSFITARETLEDSSQSEIRPAEYLTTKPNFGLRITESREGALIEQARNRPESSTLLSPVLSAMDASSTTSLLGHQNEANGKNPDHGSTQRRVNERLSEIQPEPQDSARDVNGDEERGRLSENLPEGMLAPLPTKMARFHVDGDVLDKRQRTRSHIHRTHSSLHARRLRWQKGQEGELIRAQKMLVRVEETGSGLPDDLSENESLKVETLRVDKWREYLVVCRRSTKHNAHYVLQLYKTRVIQDVENSRVRTSSCYEIHLNPKETKVNLFSALDKTVVVWHPCGHGSRMFIFRPRSAAHAVEWYTFIRQAIGWHRPSRLLINVPDLGLSLIFKRPFEQDSQIQQQSNVGGKGHVREQFAADSIVKNCMKMLGDKKEWTYVLREWSKSSKMGLAWKRYDRLEWIHGSNEQQMYGTIAMQTSHDLELRPKHHYPTRVKLATGTEGTEPTPIEGFLGLLTAQNGAEKRMGRMFFARHYFSSSDHFLFFCTPAKAAPPQPPRSFSNELQVPSTREILGTMPSKYEIDPFPLENGRISWLNNGNKAFIKRHDEEAYAQLQRTLHNICNSDGFIDLRHVSEIKPVIEGEHLNEVQNESGGESDRTYNSKNKVDSRYQFLLLLDSGLHVRLQATNGSARNEWMARLQALVEYWRARLMADVEELKAVRQHNLEILGVDEEMESILGQFAKKWEVKKAQASPHLYNMCAISGCRPVKVRSTVVLNTKKIPFFSFFFPSSRKIFEATY